jgi:D-alanyl-D-alanine carboxypeptidase/D-alanyl-D-alanine-endopeptidase (penicillin-binding protein 4)
VTSFVQMDAEVMTVEKGKNLDVEVRSVAPHRFTVRGQIPVGARPLVRIYPVDDPAGFARALFIECLRREGVTVAASPLQPPQRELPDRDAYERLPRVARFTSPPFSQAIEVTLKVSHNLYASLFPLLVAVKHGKRTLKDGLAVQREFLADLGVDVDTIAFAGGAGGANADSVTPQATVRLLQGLSRRPDYPALRAGLPVLGVDGTLADVVPEDSPARGKVFAKTGTYTWHDVLNDRTLLRSKALAGTLTTAGGRPLFFAIFLNNVPLPKGVRPEREGKVLGKLCQILYGQRP